jgi:ABC-type multidrug transport system fused ATPase/permease subunit
LKTYHADIIINKSLTRKIVNVFRGKEFLLLEEHDKTSHETNLDSNPNHAAGGDPKELIVRLDNVGARWDSRSHDQTLEGISFTVRKGGLLTIVGAVGSGKVELFRLILHICNCVQHNIAHSRLA